MESGVPCFTIKGSNLNLLPDEILLCAAVDKSHADSNINYEELGKVYTLVVLHRDENEIQFGREDSFTTIVPYYPYYLTTPFSPPRSIVYEFDQPNRIKIDEIVGQPSDVFDGELR